MLVFLSTIRHDIQDGLTSWEISLRSYCDGLYKTEDVQQI
jgi:hypothetical protein